MDGAPPPCNDDQARSSGRTRRYRLYRTSDPTGGAAAGPQPPDAARAPADLSRRASGTAAGREAASSGGIRVVRGRPPGAPPVDTAGTGRRAAAGPVSTGSHSSAGGRTDGLPAGMRPAAAQRSPHRRGARTRGARRRTVRRRRLTAFAALLVLLGVVGGTAWAIVGGDQGPAASVGNGGGVDGQSAEAAGGAPAGGTGAVTGDDSPTPTPSPLPAKPVVIEIGWIGDTTPGSQYGNPPDNGRALFTNVREHLREPDLMIANIEGTYSTATTSKGSGPNTFSFQAPPAYAEALVWAGIDVANLANNHTNDYLDLGLQQTKEALKAVEVRYAGIPGETPIVDVKGVKVAVLGFSPYPWNNDINNIAKAKKLVARASKEADLVVITMHAGAEGADLVHVPHGSEYAYGENRGDSRAFSHACIDAGADLVLGSGPHVIRGIERYKDRLIAYSLGNFGGWGNFGTGGNLSLSGLLTVRIDSTGRIRGGRWLSLYIYEPGVPSVDGGHQAANLVRELSAQDFEDTYELDAEGRFRGD